MVALRALALLVVGLVLGLAQNAVRRDGVALRLTPAPASCEATVEAPAEVDPGGASTLCREGGVVVADARTAARYAEGHIADAIHLPCDAAGQVAVEALSHVAGARTILVYGETTEEARPVASGLIRRIHDPSVRVMVLKGGFPAWSKAGLACASGPCVECKESR
jgi:rhodanese-related sulfurtransferase